MKHYATRPIYQMNQRDMSCENSIAEWQRLYTVCSHSPKAMPTGLETQL